MTRPLSLLLSTHPDEFHFEMAKAAILARKYVVIEKPFAQTVVQAKELIDLAKRNNVLLTVYQNRRWDGDFRTVQMIVEKKMVGRLVEFESHYDRYPELYYAKHVERRRGRFWRRAF